MSTAETAGPIIVKVGGSLFDWPDLGPRLRAWVARLPTPEVVLIPGGGPTADLVREFDRLHQLGEERSHWLALQAVALNAYFLAALLPSAVVVEQLADCANVWRQGKLPVLDLYGFARADEGQTGSLPHSWSITSDSLAARVALCAGARQLILLKSIDLPTDLSWTEASRRGLVDPYFPALLCEPLAVSAINFRLSHTSDRGV